MQFKHPEILYFLFLLAIPILVHLFQLRRFKKEYFTNVRFLKELSIQTRKSSKLKKWLLLATRLLLLAALVIAFAQPFFDAKDKKNVTNEMFIVLDNSFSMQAKGKKGEMLRRAVEDLLEHTPETQRFSLITNDQAFWDTDIRAIQKDLQNLKYGSGRFSVENALAQVAARRTPYNKDIVFITDAVGLQPNELRSIDAKDNAYFIVPRAEQTANVAVDSVYLEETSDNFYEIGIVLKTYGGRENDVPIALYDNEKLVAKTQVRPEKMSQPVFFTIPKADFNGYVMIADSGLEYDNRYYFSLSKPLKTNVISIGEAAKAAFLSKIYTPAEFDYANFEPGTLDYNAVEKQDAVVLNELRDIPQALQTTLKSFSEKGGNIIVIPSAEADVANLNALLQPFGAIKVGALQKGDKPVTKIAFNHPLFSTVFEKKIENFQYPVTHAAFSITSPSPAALRYEDQTPFLTTVSNPVSNVYIFSAPLSKDNGNFQNSPLIVPTFYNMAQPSTRSGITALSIGSEEPLMVDAALSKDEILSVANQDERFIPVQQALGQKVRLTFAGYPQQAGNFDILKEKTAVKAVSFNYPRTESDLFGDHAAALSGFETVESVSGVFDQLLADRTDNTIWKWFAILAILFLVTELLIQKFVK
jgi:hypothetical protein